jgi:hypothetical protein
MKRLLPVLIALLGLGAGLGAGLMLKPPPEAAVAEACGGEGEAACEEHAAADPFRSPPSEHALSEEEITYVPLARPFVVPIFAGEMVVAMVVVSLSLETDLEGAHVVEAVQPRLRDGFLKALFRHANSGGFDGSFTSGQKMDDLRLALLQAAREVMPEAPVGEVLITEIARQET